MTTRRGFLAGILAAASAPALCKAGFLMPVRQIAVPPSISDLYAENLARSIRQTGLITSAIITKEVLRMAHQRLDFISVNGQYEVTLHRPMRPPVQYTVRAD